MPLPTTGTIKHSQIMGEFGHTGAFKLSADGASLIGKSPSTLIKESDFYGASAVPEGVEEWPAGDFCTSKRTDDLNPGCAGNAGESRGYHVNPCGLKYSVNRGEHHKTVMSYSLGFDLVGGAKYEVSWEIPNVRPAYWSSGSWWGSGQFGIMAGNDCRTTQLYNINWLAKIVEQTSEGIVNILTMGNKAGTQSNVIGKTQVTAASNMNGKPAYIRFTNQNNNAFGAPFQVTVGKLSCIRIG